jgi:hypothetical protein
VPWKDGMLLCPRTSNADNVANVANALILGYYINPSSKPFSNSFTTIVRRLLDNIGLGFDGSFDERNGGSVVKIIINISSGDRKKWR